MVNGLTKQGPKNYCVQMAWPRTSANAVGLERAWDCVFLGLPGHVSAADPSTFLLNS